MKKFEKIMVVTKGKPECSDLKGRVQNSRNRTNIPLCIFSEMSSLTDK